MSTQMATPNKSEQGSATEQKIQKIRDVFADAPQLAKAALENAIRDLT